MVNNQIHLFIIFTINGFLIGILFDFFRALRKTFRTKDFVTYIEDVLFWGITGITIIISMYVFCDGELRFFMLVGLVIGILLYILILSRLVMKGLILVLKILKRIIGCWFKIIFIPIFTFFYKIVYKFILFLNKLYNNLKKLNKKRGIFGKKEKNNI